MRSRLPPPDEPKRDLEILEISALDVKTPGSLANQVLIDFMLAQARVCQTWGETGEFPAGMSTSIVTTPAGVANAQAALSLLHATIIGPFLSKFAAKVRPSPKVVVRLQREEKDNLEAVTLLYEFVW